MFRSKTLLMLTCLSFLLAPLSTRVDLAWGKDTAGNPAIEKSKTRVTLEQRKAAAVRFKLSQQSALKAGATFAAMAMTPMAMTTAPPHYFGPYPNYTNSPVPKGPIAAITVDAGGSGYTAPTVMIMDLYGTGAGATADATVVGGVVTAITLTAPGAGYSAPTAFIVDATGTGALASATIGAPLAGGIRKFVDSLPGVGPAGVNNLGQYMAVAIADTVTYPGSDYYEIELGQFSMQMHSDLPPTTLRGYRQVNSTDPAVNQFSYLGPLLVAQRDRPVRVKFTNSLPTGAGGDLFLPVDTTTMGAGMGPNGGLYTQNRATLHLHGNNTVWISDGTPHQWTTPAGEATPYPKGVSATPVPDMPDPGDGSLTFYYTNAQSARLMFYHDHSYGITRLNVLAGEAAAYLVTDQVEQDLIQGTNVTGVNPANLPILPGLGIPLVIQDRTFVDAATIGYQDPTWKWNLDANGMPTTGSLWYPHVYMPNQNPGDPSGMNAFGRWHYGPWFWPPTRGIAHGPVANPYYDPINAPWEPMLMPGTPEPSSVMEAFLDSPVVNGTVYPFIEVDPAPARFRILNAADDRFFNLQLYVADPLVTTADGRTNTEVKMVAAPDGRAGGIPDPLTSGPPIIQIGTEGGFLPAPVVLPNQPVGWNFDQTNFDFGNVNQGTLILGAAERADVIVDFSAFAGQTLILYNDSPAPFPAIDPRYDYYTGNPNLTDVGGAPSTQAGFGPNTRTIMQIRVRNVAPSAPFDLAALNSAFEKTAAKRGVFEASQDPIIVPEARYNTAYGVTNFPADPYARIFNFDLKFAPVGTTVPVVVPFQTKAIQDEMGEAFDLEYGRMSSMLGLEFPLTTAGVQQNLLLYPFASPPVELFGPSILSTPIGSLDDGTQIWKITHNGVDTHTIHTHLFNVQLINRVAWDNALRVPDPNELGWKETVRVNPLQDTFIAMRPVAPVVPFQVPNSVRPIDPTKPVGALLTPAGFPFGLNPLGNPTAVYNNLVNFGAEYVYHCHLLAHEEMDMMHAVCLVLPPEPPLSLTATIPKGKLRVQLNWVDNSVNETNFVVQRATSAAGPWITVSSAVPGIPGFGNAVTFEDKTVAKKTLYYYQVSAANVVGDTATAGFPTMTKTSAPSFMTTIMTK